MTTIEIRLNGEPRRCPDGLTVAGLVAELGRDPRSVAVEVNGEILGRPSWSAHRLATGDRLEIVHFVQGGRA